MRKAEEEEKPVDVQAQLVFRPLFPLHMKWNSSTIGLGEARILTLE